MIRDPYPGSTKDTVLEQRLRILLAGLNNMLTMTIALDFGSIAAQTTAELTVAVSGAEVGDQVVVTPTRGIESGLVWCGYISTAGTAVVRLANVTVAAIDPASRSWRVDVVKSR